MSAGERDKRIHIQRANDVANGAGGFHRTWATIAMAWAKITPTGGKEALFADTLRSVQGFRVEILFRTGLTPVDRFLWGERVLNIRSIEDPDGRRRDLVAFCETGDDG